MKKKVVIQNLEGVCHPQIRQSAVNDENATILINNVTDRILLRILADRIRKQKLW